MSISIHFNGFWSGFFEQTNPTNIKFFMRLFEEVYGLPVKVAGLDDATVLVENTQIIKSFRDFKKWTHTYLFSGESYLHPDHSKYSCVLFGNRNHDNFVNVPLYIPYIVSSFDESIILNNVAPNITKVPENEALVIVSNPSGFVRNMFCEKLEKIMNVTYAGTFKNNIDGPLKCNYNSKEFLDYVGKFKFVISMENSEEETYITEKIVHGIIGGSIPVYWGSKRIHEYFSSDRIINVDGESSFDIVMKTMKNMDSVAWLKKVNAQPFTENGQRFGIKHIAKYVKNVIFPRVFPLLDQIYFICNPEFEPERYKRLQFMCEVIGLKEQNVNFLCPTYKHTITREKYAKYVKQDLVLNIRPNPTKLAELSLTLNFRTVFEHAAMNFKDGIILTFESDVLAKPNCLDMNNLLEKLHNKTWDCINIGGNMDENSVPYVDGPTPYRNVPDTKLLLQHSIEDLSSHNDELRFSRRFHTRCTDSLLWKMDGLTKFLNHMRIDTNYGVPFDYLLINKLENDMNFKHYWSYISYFVQGSAYGYESTTIQ